MERYQVSVAAEWDLRDLGREPDNKAQKGRLQHTACLHFQQSSILEASSVEDAIETMEALREVGVPKSSTESDVKQRCS